MQSVLEAIDDPQARAMGYVRTITHPAGDLESIGPPFRIEGSPIGVDRGASPVNADARALFREVGLADDEIDGLLPSD